MPLPIDIGNEKELGCSTTERSEGGDKMKKQDLIRALEREAGSSFPNTSQIAKFMGVSRERVRSEIVHGLECIESGRSRQYFVNDVADRILSQRRV